VTETTQGHLLGGRVLYMQPAAGFRSGIEPVLLAAAIPAGPGEHVLEAGSGAGAALLCLAARVPGLSGVGIERDPELAELATRNARSNRQDRLHFVAGDLLQWQCGEPFDHAFANPPYHGDGTPSPAAGKETAKRAGPDLLRMWAVAMARMLRHRGTLTLILAAHMLPAACEALAAAGCPAACILPLWPRSGQAAKLAIIQGVKSGRAAMRLLPGLVLHGAGGFTAEAEAILRGGAGLPPGVPHSHAGFGIPRPRTYHPRQGDDP
jgi:tRNA1(Val) A37 N6-methylase TrmN6